MNLLNQQVPVIYYHSVAPKRNLSWFRNFLTLEMRFFEEQLKFLRHNHYETLSLGDLLEPGRINPGKNQLILTFDDGFLDNWVFVYPLLCKYGFKATFFVNPEFIDPSTSVRPNLFDFWEKQVDLSELPDLGFVNWTELKLMQESGYVDVQSHTLTHTKYFISDKLIGFHHPGCDSLYPVGNLFPAEKPFYPGNPEFEKLIPFGYPFFEQTSAVVARKVIINPELVERITSMNNCLDWSAEFDFKRVFEHCNGVYQYYRNRDEVIAGMETEGEYLQRVKKELVDSKREIEKNVGHRVDFICWPHGDNDDRIHEMALETGYKATTLGNLQYTKHPGTRFSRFGLTNPLNNALLTRLKARYKIDSFRGKQPYRFVKWIYENTRYGRNL